MNHSESSGGGSAAASLQPEDPSAWSSGEVLRLLLVPTVVAMLFVGGIYWARQQLSAAPTALRDQTSLVQVHLLPRPDPALIPVSPIAPSIAASVAGSTNVPVDARHPRPVEDAAVAVPTGVTTQGEISAPSVRPTPSQADLPPSSAAIRFQQALLRHVARYQHYPNAARLGRLHGSVETLFSMRRDGTVLAVWVKTSSGQVVLDKEAVDAIRRAQPLPPIPPELPDRMNIQVMLMFEPS